MYVVISGCTNGTIAFWDLSETVEDFVCQVSSLHLENSIDFQKRPRTGRGSQGGRWRRSIARAKKAAAGSTALDSQAIQEDNGPLATASSSVNSTNDAESHVGTLIASSTEAEASDNPMPKAQEISPLCVLMVHPLCVLRVHQSGVNCLHVSENRDSQSSHNEVLYDFVSGGDDQALTLIKFNVAPTSTISMDSDFERLRNNSALCQNQTVTIRFLYQKRVASAHSSAVKGKT